MAFRLFVSLIFWLLFTFPKAQAQQQNASLSNKEITEVRLRNGSILLGKLINQDAQTVTLLIDGLGEVVIRRSFIVYMVKNESVISTIAKTRGEIWFPNPNPTRYLFAPSAYPIPKGSGYYQNAYIVIHSFNYGLSNNFSIGGGTEIITPLTGGVPNIFISPKMSSQINENWAVGGGLLAGLLFSEPFGLGYGIATYGTPEKNVTFGGGYLMAEGGDFTTAVLNFSGMVRTRKRLAWVSENWWLLNPDISNGPFSGLWFSYGIRLMGESISADVAFINNAVVLTEIFPLGIPYLDFVYTFKKRPHYPVGNPKP